jgi:hypothetical protein
MAVVTTPKVAGAISPNRMAAAIAHGTLGRPDAPGPRTEDGAWIVPDTRSLLAAEDPALDADGPLNAFGLQYWRRDDHEIQIDSGEAVLGGRYLASDDPFATETDQATGNDVEIHEVTLPTDSEDVSVFLGIDVGQPDRIVFGTDDDVSGWPSTWPRCEIFNFDTDSDGISGSPRDRRPTTRRINAVAREAEQAQTAGSAERFGGAGPGSYARTDTEETFEESINFNGPELEGDSGTADGELFRIGTGFSDVVFHASNGAGRFQVAYNAEYKNGAWRIIRGGENCSVLAMNSSEPGLSFGAIVAIGGFSVLASDKGAGDPFEWEWLGWDRGEPWTNGQKALTVPRRQTSPDSTQVPDGTVALWYRPP